MDQDKKDRFYLIDRKGKSHVFEALRVKMLRMRRAIAGHHLIMGRHFKHRVITTVVQLLRGAFRNGGQAVAPKGRGRSTRRNSVVGPMLPVVVKGIAEVRPCSACVHDWLDRPRRRRVICAHLGCCISRRHS